MGEVREDQHEKQGEKSGFYGQHSGNRIRLIAETSGDSPCKPLDFKRLGNWSLAGSNR